MNMRTKADRVEAEDGKENRNGFFAGKPRTP